MRTHKVFKGLAALGKSSSGWVFGFKLQAVINASSNLDIEAKMNHVTLLYDIFFAF
ncbi:MAG: transposase [Candidatus Symbiodolus clandestinus]